MHQRLSDGFPPEMTAEIRDALGHYYDQAYLVRHPLLARLGVPTAGDANAAVQELRRLLARSIQLLRPRPDTPLSDPAWRPYAVLHRRYILSQELTEVENELTLGRRQVLREQRKGLEAIALALWEGRSSAPAGAFDDGDSALRQEISRVGSDQQGVDLQSLLPGILEPLEVLSQRYGVDLIRAGMTGPVHAFCNPALLKQLAVAVLSFAVRSSARGRVRVELLSHSQQTILSCQARLPEVSGIPLEPSALPEPILALAQAQRVTVDLHRLVGGFRVDIALPSAARERVVALVEDNEDTVRLFSRFLGGRGYRLVGITDSVRALSRIAEIMPDVVVLDLMMSDVDGWEILQKLKSDPRLEGIPVVISSVLDEPELALSIGASAYLRKPVRATQLLDCLAALVAP